MAVNSSAPCAIVGKMLIHVMVRTADHQPLSCDAPGSRREGGGPRRLAYNALQRPAQAGNGGRCREAAVLLRPGICTVSAPVAACAQISMLGKKTRTKVESGRAEEESGTAGASTARHQLARHRAATCQGADLTARANRLGRRSPPRPMRFTARHRQFMTSISLISHGGSVSPLRGIQPERITIMKKHKACAQ